MARPEGIGHKFPTAVGTRDPASRRRAPAFESPIRPPTYDYLAPPAGFKPAASSSEDWRSIR